MKRAITPMNLSLCIVLLVLLFFCGIQSKQAMIATFNKEAILSSFVRQLSTHDLSDEALAQKTKRFNQALTLSLDEYAHLHHAVILDIKTVSASSNDVTKEILMRVANKMRGES